MYHMILKKWMDGAFFASFIDHLEKSSDGLKSVLRISRVMAAKRIIYQCPIMGEF